MYAYILKRYLSLSTIGKILRVSASSHEIVEYTFTEERYIFSENHLNTKR